VGDFCAKDDILVLIETDKVTIEAPIFFRNGTARDWGIFVMGKNGGLMVV